MKTLYHCRDMGLLLDENGKYIVLEDTAVLLETADPMAAWDTYWQRVNSKTRARIKKLKREGETPAG